MSVPFVVEAFKGSPSPGQAQYYDSSLLLLFGISSLLASGALCGQPQETCQCLGLFALIVIPIVRAKGTSLASVPQTSSAAFVHHAWVRGSTSGSSLWPAYSISTMPWSLPLLSPLLGAEAFSLLLGAYPPLGWFLLPFSPPVGLWGLPVGSVSALSVSRWQGCTGLAYDQARTLGAGASTSWLPMGCGDAGRPA